LTMTIWTDFSINYIQNIKKESTLCATDPNIGSFVNFFGTIPNC